MLWSYGNTLCAKKTKTTTSMSSLLRQSSTHAHVTRVPRRMRVHFSACKQGTAHACSTSEYQLLRQQHHTHASWFSREWRRTDPEERKSLNKVIIFVFLVQKKYSQSFIKLQLNHWCHINYFNKVFTRFLGLERDSSLAGSESSWTSSKIS